MSNPFNTFVLFGTISSIRQTEYTGHPSACVTIVYEDNQFTFYTAPGVPVDTLNIGSMIFAKGLLHPCTNDSVYLYVERITIITKSKGE